MRFPIGFIALAVILSGALLGGDAQATDAQVRKLKSDMAQLQQQMTDLQAAQRQQGADIAQKMAAIEQMQADWSGFQGNVDAISQQQQLLLDQLRKFIDEFDARLQAVEQGAQQNAGPSSSVPFLPSAPKQTSDAGVNSTSADTKLYQTALNEVRGHNYSAAITKFRNLLRQHSASPLADGAQYWIAECYFAQGKYRRAIQEYQDVLNYHPNSSKGPSALLKQGAAYVELGLIDEAKAQLKLLIARAPHSNEAKRAKTHLRTLARRDATATRSSR